MSNNGIYYQLNLRSDSLNEHINVDSIRIRLSR